jgi:hypothetical protein
MQDEHNKLTNPGLKPWTLWGIDSKKKHRKKNEQNRQAHWPLRRNPSTTSKFVDPSTLKPYSGSENRKKHRKNDELKQAWKLQTSTRFHHNLVCSWAVPASSSTLNLKPCKEKRTKRTQKTISKLQSPKFTSIQRQNPKLARIILKNICGL